MVGSCSSRVSYCYCCPTLGVVVQVEHQPFRVEPSTGSEYIRGLLGVGRENFNKKVEGSSDIKGNEKLDKGVE